MIYTNMDPTPTPNFIGAIKFFTIDSPDDAWKGMAQTVEGVCINGITLAEDTIPVVHSEHIHDE